MKSLLRKLLCRSTGHKYVERGQAERYASCLMEFRCALLPCICGEIILDDFHSGAVDASGKHWCGKSSWTVGSASPTDKKS
jgi:hypothetical protein